MGSDHTFAKALYKAFAGAKMQLPETVMSCSLLKIEIRKRSYQLLRDLQELVTASLRRRGTADFLKKHDLHVDLVTKVHEDEAADDNILNELRDSKIDLVINTMGHDIEKNS